MTLFRHALIILTLLSPAAAWAVQPDEVLSDPALETRARVLSKELRCMVCQNQSIDDSAAPLARDLRVLVRERLTGGDSDQQVLNFLVDRYGEFVLLKPRFAWHTALHQPIPEYSGLVSNLAFPISPPAIAAGAVYEFSINHVMHVDKPGDTYTLTVEET